MYYTHQCIELKEDETEHSLLSCVMGCWKDCFYMNLVRFLDILVQQSFVQRRSVLMAQYYNPVKYALMYLKVHIPF